MLEFNLSQIELDLKELQTTDLHELINFKLSQAYKKVQAPVLVEDTSLYFVAWNNLPGPLIKYFLDNLGVSGIVRALEVFNNNSANAACCLGFTQDGKNMQIFEGKVKGVIVNPRGSQNFGWDSIFLPEGCKKTFGEMSSHEKHQISPRGIAVKKFNHFLKLQAEQK